MESLLLADRLDMVVAARIDREEAAYRLGRRFGNKLPTAFVANVFGNTFTDILSGYRVFSRRFVKSFPAPSGGFDRLSCHRLRLVLDTVTRGRREIKRIAYLSHRPPGDESERRECA